MNHDAKVDNEIFRKDHPVVLACNAHQASLKGVRLAQEEEDGYQAGQVLVRNSGTGFYEKYSSSSGSYDAACILLHDVDPEAMSDDNGASGTALARGIFAGEVYLDKLVDYDSGVLSELKGREIVDAKGTEILRF